MASPTDPRQTRGIMLLLVLVFVGAVYGVAYLLTGRLLASQGVGYALGVGIAAGLASLIVCGGAAKLARGADAPALRFLGPVLLLVAAGAIFWFLALPVVHRPDTFYGYQGTYRVTYSDGRTEKVDGSVLNEREWSRHAGGWLALVLAPACIGLWELGRSLREGPAPPPA